jgi:hypothetical protein
VVKLKKVYFVEIDFEMKVVDIEIQVGVLTLNLVDMEIVYFVEVEIVDLVEMEIVDLVELDFEMKVVKIVDLVQLKIFKFHHFH